MRKTYKFKCAFHQVSLDGEPQFITVGEEDEWELDLSEMSCPSMPLMTDEEAASPSKEYDDAYDKCVGSWHLVEITRG
jgi:hypothetical protein